MNILLQRILRPIWHRRHHIITGCKSFFNWLFVTLDKIPLPQKSKILIKDFTFLAISHLILHSDRFSSWRNSQTGTARIQYLLTQNAESEKTYLPDIPAPSHEQWAQLHGQHNPENAEIDVIIPVYSGYAMTLNAIYAAIKTRSMNETPYKIIVIDDASPDLALSSTLRSLARDGLFELHANVENLGFVQTVNKGMSLSDVRDVILLNADTEVYNNWLDRIVLAARSDSSIATVTPMSNNAEICSYPYFVQNNQRELELPYEQLDLIFARQNTGVVLDVPTGVGFCMYISRSSLKDVGLFDVEHFGKGYGEENDFCMRALAKGWRNVLLADTFVRHIGGVSFGKSKQKRITKAYEVLLSLHPHYHNLVGDFVRQDSPRKYRRNVDTQRIKIANNNAKSILMINHQMGGGTERNVREICSALAAENIGHIVLEPSYLGGDMVMLKHYTAMHTVNLLFSMDYDRAELIECLRELNVFHLHIHHLVNFPPRIVNLINLIKEELNLQYDFTLHDYYTICPRINLIDDNNQYCGEPEVSDCERCIQKNHSHAAGAAVWQWRDGFERLLSGARKIFAPDFDVAQRINNYYPDLEIDLRPHFEVFDNGFALEANEGKLKIAVVGAISGLKGSKVLSELVKDANRRSLDIEYVLIGYSDRSDLHNSVARFNVTGKYEEHEIGELLKQHQPTVIFIPTPLPETYCYALSIAWRFGVKPVVFDIGAQANRIRALGDGAGEILPLELSAKPQQLNDWLLQNIKSGVKQLTKPDNVKYDSIMRDYYGFSVSKPKTKKQKATEVIDV
jgi:GT2 family glycosyltransferase